MTDPYAAVSTRRTPQSQPVTSATGARADVPNAAGGHTFAVDDLARLHRFLTIGTTGGTYYASEAAITKQNADVFLPLFANPDTARAALDLVVQISLAGRAPRQQPGLLALAALCAVAPDDVRASALAAIPQVCRTASTLFTFAGYVEQFRGWGRGLRRAVAHWYLDDRTVDDLAYQVVKYRQRDGWTHRDLLRLAHPAATDPARRALFDYACGRNAAHLDVAPETLPEIVQGFELAQRVNRADGSPAAGRAWVGLIGRYPALSWEMLPDAALTDPTVWEALIEQGLPQGALLRQLPRLTRLGLFDKPAVRHAVRHQLVDPDRLRRARIHPINVLLAARTYAAGRSDRGSSTWSPHPQIVDALDAAFYAAFAAVEPTHKRWLIALDISGSMGSAAGGTPLSCREVAAALALVVKSTEVDADVIGFTSTGWQASSTPGRSSRVRSGWTYGVQRLDITPRRRLDDVVRYTAGLPMGGTDCALPMIWAQDHGEPYDAVVVITDNETWSGAVHPHQALREYRASTSPNARLAVVALTASGNTIADPLDPGQLDVSGFDAAVPSLLADFVRGAV
jgi:60 kDa SS-A/Ro ribonucleoprotein